MIQYSIPIPYHQVRSTSYLYCVSPVRKVRDKAHNCAFLGTNLGFVSHGWVSVTPTLLIGIVVKFGDAIPYGR